MRKLKLFLSLLMVMAFSVGNVWATLPASPTWEAQALADIADGSTIIIISNSTTATNIALPAAGAGSSNPPKKACTVTTTAGVTTITPPNGTTLQDLAWTVSKQASSWKFYVEGSTTNCLYLTGTSSNTALRVGEGSSNNEFVMGDLGKLLKVTTATRFVGPNDNGGTDWRTYNTENASNYKGAQLTFYVLKAAPSCSNTVTITKGSETNGTYTLSATEICGDGEGEDVTISDITPAAGFAFDEITTSASGTVDNVNKKVTGITANTTITVKFKELQKYTVSFNTGAGNPAVSPITEATAGAGITLPAGPTPACSADGWTFAGWAAAVVGEETTTAPTLLSGNYNPTDNVTLYAVYKRTEEGGGSEIKYVQVTALSQINAGGSFIITNGTKYLPSTTTSSTVAQADMVEITAGVVTGTIVDAMKWSFSAADKDGYITITNADSKYLYATASNSGLRVNNTSDSWKFEEYTVSEVLGFAMQEKTNSRYCAVYTDGSDWRTYTTKNATNYKTNSGRLDLYKATEVSASTTYYLSAPSCCTKHNIELVLGVQHGSISADLAEACEGTEVTLTATPDAHCAFVAWDVKQGETPVAVSDNKFTMPDGNVTVSATFAEIKNAVTFAAPAGGTLSIMNGEDAVATGAQIVEGTALTVTATPDAENHYIGGTIKVVKTSDESDVTASVLDGSTLTMPNYAITVSATFTPTYAINLVAEGGSIALDYTKGGAADGYAIAGTTISAEATADDAHVFASLTVSENVTEPTIVESLAEFVMPAEAVTVTATFDVKSTPTIATDVTEVAFDATDYKGELAAKTFYVNGVALAEGNLTIACDNDAFTVSPTSIPVNGALEDTEITVTPKTTACGTFNATITISGGNAAAKEVSVSLTVNKLASNLAWSAEEATVTIDANDNVFPTLTNPRKLPVVYSSLDDEVASIDENGAVTLKKAGETLIIVNFAGNDTVTALAEDALSYTLTVQQKYTAKWFVNGEELTESTQTAVAGTDLIVPSNPTKLADDCDDMVFKGWAEAAIVSKQDEAPTYTTKTKMPEADVNFYAVFASEVPGAPVQKVDNIDNAFIGVSGTSYVAWTDKVGVSGAVYAGSSAGGNDAVQLRSNKNADGLVVTSTGAGKVTNVTVAWNTNTAATRTIDIYGKNTPYSAASDLYGENAGTLLGSINIDNATSLDVTGDYTYIGIRSNSGALYLDNIAVKWIVPGETTYTNYMTTCPSCPKVNLLKAATEHGSYTFQQSGIAVTSVKTCEAAATVDVVFAPELGYELANFQISELEGVSYADGVLTIAQNAAGNLTTSAAFALKNYSVAMTQTGGASATLSEDQAGKHMGDEITISTTLPEGYYFVGWEATPAVVFADATAPNTTFTMPASDVTIKAKFAWIRPVADALSKIPNENDFFGGAAVEGYVSGNISYSDKYKSLTYDIRAVDANGFLTGDVLQVYSGKGIDGADFSSENDIKVGAKVRIYGDLKNYKGTREFNANSKQFYYEEAANPSVVVYGDATKKNYYYKENFEFDGLKAKQVFGNGYAVEIASPVWSATPEKVTATGNVAVTAEYEDITSSPFDVAVIKVLRQANIAWSATEADAYVEAQPYELPILSNPNSLTVSYSSMAPDVADFAGESLQLKAAGEAVIKAAFAGNEEYEAAEVSYTLHVYGYESVTIEGNADVTAYEAGEAFNYAGLTAMANYRASETLTRSFVIPNEDVAWSADPAAIEASTTTVTVSATWLGKTGSKDVDVAVYTHKITFEAPANGSLAVKNGEEAIASGDEFAKGTVLTVEATPASDDYKLATLTVNGNDIKEAKQFTVGTELQYEVVATFVPKAEAGIEWKDTDGDKVYVGYMEVKGDEIDDSDLPELDNPNGLSIVYSSDNTAVAEIDPATGVITPKANGNTTISATFAGDNDYLSATVSFDLNVEIIEPEFYVIGSFNSWAKFVPVYDWFYEFEDLTPGDYQLKVTTAPNWSEAYGYDALTIKHAGLSKDNEGNICFTISNESGMNFVSVEFEKNEEGLSRFAVIGTYVKPTFTVVGVEALVGYNWDAGLNVAENEMLEDPETGNYELEKEDVMLAAGDYEYQVAMNHNWRGVDNSTLTITESGRYNVTFTYVPSTGATSAVAELQEAIVVIPTVAVKGSWNEWAASTTLTPAENKETASVTIELAAGSYEFGMEINSNWTANGSAFTRDANSKAVSGSTGNMTIVADVAGEYTFTWTFDGNLLSIAYPELPEPEYYIAGDFTDWGTNKVKMTEDNSALVATVSISSTDEQTFKVLRVQGPYETWYGLENYAKMTSENCTDWTIGGGESNIGLEPTKAGEYTFVFVPAELKLTVNMPAKGSGTALDNTEADTKAVKTMENGVLIIRRGDKTYNGQGQLLR